MNGDTGPRTDSFDRILGLYEAPFLSDEEETPWALPFREKLHVKILARLRTCARHAEAAAQTDAAIALYQRALEIDDLVEEFYRGMIRCHSARGECSEAVRTYRRCQRVLSARLGVEPSPETRRLYQSLVSSAPPARHERCTEEAPRPAPDVPEAMGPESPPAGFTIEPRPHP